MRKNKAKRLAEAEAHQKGTDDIAATTPLPAEQGGVHGAVDRTTDGPTTPPGESTVPNK